MAKPAAWSDHTTLNYTSPDMLQEDLTEALEKGIHIPLEDIEGVL